MTISTTASRISYNGNGVTVAFSFPYRFLINSDVVVVLRSSTGVESVLTLTTHYTLSGAGADAGCTVTMVTAPAVGERLVIYRDVAITQEVDYISGDPFPAETHERAIDRLTMIDQQQQDSINRTLRFPVSDTVSPDLPSQAVRAGKFLAFDDLGRPTVAVPVEDSAADVRLDLSISDGAARVGLDHQTVYDVLKNGRVDLSEVERPASPPVAALGAAGNLTGATAYSVTFVTAYGETDVSANSNTITPAAQRVVLTGIPVSSDPDVIARRIYRTKAGGADPVLGHLVETINDNTTTTYTDNIAEGALGAPGPRFNTAGGAILKNGQRIAQASSHSTAFGMDCHTAETGYANTAFGAQCMKFNTTGYRNSAFGIFALYKNTTGARNSAFGVHALNESTTANDGTAFGYAAAISLTTGQGVTAIGSNALAANTTASFNVAVGLSSMVLTTTGGFNVAVGTNTMFNNTTGQQNVAVGHGALKDSVTGNFNTSVGSNAAEKTTGSSNVAVGYGALLNNVTGSGSVAIGFQAGYYETAGNRLYIANGAFANQADARAKSLLYGVFGSGAGDQSLQINAAVGINGNTPVGKVAVNAAATDLATAVALVNQLRAQLIAFGLVS